MAKKEKTEEAPKPQEVKGVGGRPPNRPSPSAKKK
jgi:hypothetical protein